jgi:glutamate racemase
VGVYDSGIGGLTVLKALLERFPGERFLYLGDTAKVPYGNKSTETITRYALESTLFLLSRGVKAVVVACNTVSATCLDQLSRHFRAPVIGVIDPAVDEAIRMTRRGKIGVVGTARTIESGAYERALLERVASLEVRGVPCPLFVPLAEEGFADHAATRLIVEEYLTPLCSDGVDTVILGCTHYPLLRSAIAAFLGPDVALVDSGPATATALASILDAHRLRGGAARSAVAYCLTDRQPRFRAIGERFLGQPIETVEVVAL